MSRSVARAALLLTCLSVPMALLWGATPVITSLSTTSGQPGIQVTVNGTGFGSSPGTVTFNGAVAQIVSWNAAGTQIVTKAPGGTSGSGPVVVNGHSNGVNFSFTPTVNIASPQNVAIGQTVTLIGLNFGATTGTVTVSGKPATLVSWTAKRIGFIVPATASTGADPVVVTNSVGSSPAVTLNVQFSPATPSISPVKGAPFTPVTITGSGFGNNTPGKVTFNGVSAQIVSWTNTKVMVNAPDGLAGSGPVVISWRGTSSNAGTFSFLPTILALIPSTVKVGFKFGIIGENFLGSPGSVTLNGAKLTTSFWSNFLIIATVPAGAQTGPVVVITTVGASNSQTLTVQGGTAPLTITAMASPPPNAAGWNNTTVTVTFTCNGGVAPVTCPAAQTVATEGANQTITGTAKDGSGKTASASVVLNIDKTVPVITASVAPPANSNSWINQTATVTFTCTDSLSGIASCPSPLTVTQGANQVISGTATDKAGNSGSTSVTLNVSTTLPTITATVTPAPNANGWNTTPVTVNYTCAEGFAPITSCPAPQTISTAGANQQVKATVTDVAGNSATNTTILNIELVGPKITATVTPAPNANGWNNTPVTVSFTCIAGSAPIATCSTPQTLSTPGANQPVTGTVTDVAGASASTTVNLNIDLTPPVISASVSPAPNASGWINNSAALVTYTCSDSLSGVSNCPTLQTISTPGANQTITATATDNAGNTATATTTLNIELTPPVITAIASPAPNPQGWNNSAVTVSFRCSGGSSGGLQCPASQTVSTEGANQTIAGHVTDTAGNTNSTSATINIDTTPPAVTITSPASGTTVSTSNLAISGTVSDALSGLSSVTCNGGLGAITSGSFTCNTRLLPGANNISVRATDIAGNAVSASLPVNFVNGPAIAITSPTALALFSANPITIAGTIDDPQATVSANGIAGSISGNTFTIAGVNLREAKNLLTVTAINAAGGISAATVTVFLDTTPPQIHIDSPTDGAIVNSSQITVMGNVNDLVSGTVNGDQVSVTVNGVTADVANRSFAAQNVLLVPGSNTIIALAKDRAGNVSQHQITLTLQDVSVAQHLKIVAGNNQTAAINSVLPQPLVAQALDGLGRPLANRTLSFHVSRSDGTITAYPESGRDLTVQTDANGLASVELLLGSRSGVGINQVSVTALGFVGETTFVSTSTIGAPAQIRTVSGALQKGAAGSPLPEPFVAIVFDAGGNPLPNVPITFRVDAGGGTIDGTTSVQRTTDSDGKAYAVLTLALQEGINNNSVSASITGINAPPASFVSSGVVTGPASATTISGIVLDNADQPIPNATASVKGTNFSALTNSQGQFTIAGAPVGEIVLFVDGSTSTRPQTFPTLSFQMVSLSGIDNRLSGPIYLPELDTQNSQVVGGNQDVVLTMKNVPGVAYKVFAHSATFSDGSKTGRLTLAQVHADRVPMIPPNGSTSSLVATVQPAGVSFDPPIQIQVPNTEGLAPGQVTEFYGFRHDLEQFVSEGTVRVSDDGSVLVSDTGFGLRVSGWDLFVNPRPLPTTCTSSCSTCKFCAVPVGICVPNPLANGISCIASSAPGVCKTGDCVPVTAKVSQVTFSGASFHAVTKDDGSSFDPPQWTDSGTQSPVSYTSNTTVTVQAVFKLSNALQGGVIQVTGNAPNGLQFKGTGSLSGDMVTLPATASTQMLPNSIMTIDPFKIQWTISIDGKDTDAGSSSNKMYVTLHDPTASTLYETLLLVDGQSAGGVSDDASAVPAIWSTFQHPTAGVTRADGVVMGYWTGGISTCQTLQGMLASSGGDGSCVAWSQFFHQALEAQGITGSQIFQIRADTTVNPGADGFLVKSWTFGQHIRTGGNGINDSDRGSDDVNVIPKGSGGPPDQPAITPGANGLLESTRNGDDTIRDGLFAGTLYPYLLFQGSSVFGVYGSPFGDVAYQRGNGQKNPAPPPFFFNHFVVKFGGQIYDPSYGAGPFPNENAHENASIDGIKSGNQAKKNAPIQELNYTRYAPAE